MSIIHPKTNCLTVKKIFIKFCKNFSVKIQSFEKFPQTSNFELKNFAFQKMSDQFRP